MQHQQHPLIEVDQGKLKGKLCKSDDGKEYYCYKGIPYAKPPIGELRFAIPQPPEPWEGVRDATVNSNICIQFDKEINGVIGDEDCLYLNVYVPKKANYKPPLPVMVFIHGGGFVFGNGTDDSVHGPDFLVEKDVIVISFNYRLGILGFLSLNCKDAPGNMGLRDQVEVLKWVQKNINKFGGDSNNVTIFGISAGGVSVEYLLLSPMAKGLFHKAIAQSGSTLLHWGQNNKIRQLASMIPILKAKVLTDDEQLLKYLKSLPAKDLVTISMLVLAADEFKGGIHFGFVPTVENPGDWKPFLDKSPYEIISKGEFTKVPYMTGFCTREGLLMVPFKPEAIDTLAREKKFLNYLPFELDEAKKTEIENRLKTAYLETENIHDEPDAFAIDFFSDVDFIGGIHVAASMIAKKNSPVYYYEFAYDGSQNYVKKKHTIDRKGACHGDDGGYLIKSDFLPKNLSDTDKMVRDRLTTMWANFAKYGDPTPKTDDLLPTKWEPIAETGIACLQIDDKLTMKYEVYPIRMKIFEELYSKHYKC